MMFFASILFSLLLRGRTRTASFTAVAMAADVPGQEPTGHWQAAPGGSPRERPLAGALLQAPPYKPHGSGAASTAEPAMPRAVLPQGYGGRVPKCADPQPTRSPA